MSDEHKKSQCHAELRAEVHSREGFGLLLVLVSCVCCIFEHFCSSTSPLVWV